MLTFREIDYEKDLEEIIDLLNKNFNSTHTLSHFKWKHQENPFGRSYGLLAFHENKIVGLRMFMKWKFHYHDQIINAIRPVDTCTDHSFRGKGLFKKLTLEGIQNQESNYLLIFNTPNNNSKPGYLKMGWEESKHKEVYKLGVKFFPSGKNSYKFIKNDEVEIPAFYTPQQETLLTTDYLRWRYKDPDFKIARFNDGSLVFFKIGILKGLKTLILYDSISEVQTLKLINAICSVENLSAFYYLNDFKNKSLNTILSFTRNLQTVVYKEDKLELINNIKFSLSDLEGKL